MNTYAIYNTRAKLVAHIFAIDAADALRYISSHRDNVARAFLVK